jgi:TrmH family RNA methyltransferase
VYHSYPTVPDITSRQHSLVQQFKLAARGEGDAALLDGWHLLREAAQAALDITVVAVSNAPTAPDDIALLGQLSRRADVVTVTNAVLEAMSPVRTPAGVVALAPRKTFALSSLLSPPPALVIVAVNIQDPGNAGAIVRSAEAGGATGVLFLGSSADPWNWKALRAAMGSTFRLPTHRSPDLHDTLIELRHRGVRLLATVPRDGVNLRDADMRAPTAVVVGGEGSGLDDAVVRATDVRISIPMHAPVESLNVAVATALVVYEAQRQREV